jgi:hypothetical protein
MVKDHRPAIAELVWEFYTNLHRRAGNSFLTWVRGIEIHVTPDLISAITKAPRVRTLEYPWPVDHLSTQAEMVACFTEGRLHRMETEGEGSFEVHDFSNEVRCIYRVVMSCVLPVLSLTMITMDRARCLYALLTETSIDYGSVVTVAMMSVRHADSCTTLPYGVLITRIVQHAEVDTDGMIELAPENGPITTRYLNASMRIYEMLRQHRGPDRGGQRKQTGHPPLLAKRSGWAGSRLHSRSMGARWRVLRRPFKSCGTT